MKEGDPSKHYHYSLLEFCSELLLLLDCAQFDSVQFDSASASESFAAAAAAAAAVDSADSLAAEKQ